MNDKQRVAQIDKAVEALKKTKVGYNPEGIHWRTAMNHLRILRADLMPSPVPPLGPVWQGGKSVLLHDLTHATSGIPLYPAFDDAFTVGRAIIAPEDIEVTRASSSRPGDAFYATGTSKLRYWFGHLVAAPEVGQKIRKGMQLGTVAPNSIGGGPHVHVGINIELLLGKGKQLIHHTNYTHGAPTVGVQLAKALET